ncbi:MAG TPA: sigma-70 family RNA polymerase sigma factor [Acidimicrobiales bacterium]|nr:sigma-70 family RNA polymerase sigma factor [Acidimicrobiales bacterium]
MALAPTDVASIEETTAIRLVTAHRCGDGDAFDQIVRTHYPSLLASARHRLGNTEDAKDAVQETLLRALLALDRFGDTGDWRLGAWLNTILFHVCADIPAHRKPTAPLTDWLIESHPDESAESTSDYLALAAVQRAIDELPQSQRRAFELRLVDGRSYGEVARALDITEVNARARVSRARAALQHALEESSAVKGAWAGIPLLLTAPVRTVFRRVFSGAGDAARTAGSQALASGAPTTGSSAVSAIAGTPVQTGIQLLTQVSATPLGQAVVASATGAPGKGSVVLGIVASLATAGGLAAPAAISGTTHGTTPPARVASTMIPASSTPLTAATGSPSSSSSPSGSPSSPASGSTTTPPPATQFAPPAWLALAASAVAYRTSAPSSASTGAATTAPSSPANGSGAVTTSPSSSTSQTSATGSAPAPGTGQPGTTAGVPSGGGTATSPASPPAQNGVVPLPIGTCTGVTGFPGVTAPTSVPALSSSSLNAVLSTGSLNLASVAGSPAFAGTGLLELAAGSSAATHLKVGTCLAEGGSVLAVDLTGTTGIGVQLVGSLVAQPFVTATGADAYLFRGNVTQLSGPAGPGGQLPWGLPSGFVAEVQIQQSAKTGSLGVIFLKPPSPTPAGAATASSSATTATGGTVPSTADATGTQAASTAGAGTTPSGTGTAHTGPPDVNPPAIISGGS